MRNGLGEDGLSLQDLREIEALKNMTDEALRQVVADARVMKRE